MVAGRARLRHLTVAGGCRDIGSPIRMNSAEKSRQQFGVIQPVGKPPTPL
jgi:hypothetical protein